MEYSDYVESRTHAETLDGSEKLAGSKAGVSVEFSTQQVADLAGSGITSEFNRTFSAELLFDKDDIDYEEHELTGDLVYTVAPSGNLADRYSSATQIIKTDGTRTVTFTGWTFVLGDVQSGSIPDAGTYLVTFLFWNGKSAVNWTKPSLEVANLTPLSAPANFSAVPGTDPDSEVDLSWDAVPNVSSYEIQYSVSGGGGPWIALATPAAGDTAYTHTGLTASTTYHYRIRAIGDGVAFSNSGYSIVATTTQDAGDVTVPTFVFSPADAATDIPMNGVATITASEAIRKTDASEITNANVAALLTVKVDNIAGADIPFTATINAGKNIITITPNVVWPAIDQVFIQLAAVEDSNGNTTSAVSATFTTNDYTLMSGNYLRLFDMFDAIVTGNDINFELEYEFKDAIFSGYRGLFQKQTTTTSSRSFIFATGEGGDNDVLFRFYGRVAPFDGIRTLKWTGALTGVTSGKITVKYFGAIDTNNGLDRADLYLDDVLVGSKTLVAEDLLAWPFAINPSTAILVISGPTTRQVKNAFIRNNFGATVQGSYPVIRTGIDTSGNARHGTWV